MWVSEEGSGKRGVGGGGGVVGVSEEGVGGGEWEKGGGVVRKVGAGARRGQPHAGY